MGAGAGEIDMVMAIGQAKSGEWRYVEDDVRRVVDAAGHTPVKVILETAALEPVEIAAGCLVARAAGAAYVKTSTGFHPSGGAKEGVVAADAAGGRLGPGGEGVGWDPRHGESAHPDAGGRGRPHRDAGRGGHGGDAGTVRATAQALVEASVSAGY